jgi:hypothetical protein
VLSALGLCLISPFVSISVTFPTFMIYREWWLTSTRGPRREPSAQ